MACSYCEDCGCKVYNGSCTNCHEETFIAEQYREMGEPVPQIIAEKELEQSYQKQWPKAVKKQEEERLPPFIFWEKLPC